MLSLKILKPVNIIGQEYKIGDTVEVHKTLIHHEVAQVSSAIKVLLDANLIEAVSANKYKVLGDIVVNVVGQEYKKGDEFVSSPFRDYVDEVDYPAWIAKGVVDGLWSLLGADVHVTGVTIDHATFSIEEAATLQLAAVVAPANATDTSGVWASSDATVATVDQNGLVTAIKAGTANITFTSTDGAKVGTAAGTVTIKVIVPTSAAISPASPTVAVGATVQLNATVSPAGATDKTGVWSTADAAIATVSQTGLVTGVAAGTVAITFTTNSGGKKANRNVVVS